MIKRSLIVKILAGVFVVSAVSTGAVLVLQNREPVPENVITAGHTAMAQPPSDGSLPDEHTGMENLSYMAYNLRSAAAYRSEAFSTVSTKVGFISYTQEVETYKDYAGGVMVTEDIAKSSLVNSAMQTCFVGGRALWRNAASSSAKDWQGKDTAWSEGEPSNYSEEDYMRLYGLPSTEFSVYVLNEETVADCSAVTDNGDGTYTQTFYPDTQTAGQYYVRRMKTMGGLSDYPVFNSIEITYTFDASWRVLSSRTVENYAVSLGIISSDDCSAVTEQTYYYEADKVDVSDYENFFSRYVESESQGDIEGDRQPTAADYLSAAFAPVLADGAQFRLTGALGEMPLSGRVFAGMVGSSVELRAELGDIALWFSEGKIYVRAGENLVALSAETLGEIAGAAGLGDALGGLDLNALLSQLAGGQLVQTDGGATLFAALELAGMSLPLTFEFSRSGEDIALEYVALEGTEFAGESLSLRLEYDDGETLPALTAAEKAAAADLGETVEGLLAWQGAVRMEGTLSLTVGDAAIDLDIVRADVDLKNGIALFVQARLHAFGTVSEVFFGYDGNEFSLACGGIGAKVRAEEFSSLAAAAKEAYDRIAACLPAADAADAVPLAGLPGLSALLSSEEFAAFFDSLRVVEEEGILRASFRLLSADVSLSCDGETVTAAGGAGETLSFRLQLRAGGAPGKMPAGTDYLSAEELELLLGHAADLFALSQRTEWNIGYTMSVNNGEKEEYAVSGGLQIVAAQADRAFAASLTVAAVPASAEGKSCYLTFTVYEGKIYITASYYRDAAENAAYAPLCLAGELTEVSRMAGMLQTFLGGDLSFLQDLLGSVSSLTAVAEAGEICLSDVLCSLSADGQKAVLTLNGDPLFGAGTGNFTLALDRTAGGGYALSAEGLRLGASSPAVSLRAELLSAPCAVMPAEAEYIDFSTVSGLLESVLQSFFTTSENGPAFLDGYYFGGTVSGNIGSFAVSFDVAVNVLCGETGIKINASVAADSKFAVNSGAYKTYITLDPAAGTVSMVREQYEYYRILWFQKYDTPVVTSRTLTLEAFAADYWNQIVYITNMGDTLASIIDGIIESSPADPGAGDADIGTYLQSYACDGGVYRLTLNGSAFASFLGDMNLALTCGGDGSIVNIAGDVDIYVTLSLDLDFENVTKPAGDYSLPADGVPSAREA